MTIASRGAAWMLLVFLPMLTAGCATPNAEPAPPAAARFHWQSAGPGMLDLYRGERRLVRYMYAYDPSTPERLEETYKVYHHVYDETGEQLLTKGPGGLYTHHRGLFLGWNRLMSREHALDFWHMTTVSQRHVATLGLEADHDGARQRAVIHWCDAEGKAVLREVRTVAARAVAAPGLLLLHVTSELTPVQGDVVLAGDPEHAGFQFRAHDAVAEAPAGAKATYIFPGPDIDPTKDADIPWAAMSYPLRGGRYHVLHMNGPDNPSPTLYSAYRDYGRFGAFPVARINHGDTLTLRYGIYVGIGPTPERPLLQRIYDEYLAATEATG